VRVGVVDDRTGLESLVLEDLNVPEPDVVFQILDPPPEHLEDSGDVLCGETSQRRAVLPSLYDNLVCPDISHAIIDAFGLSTKITFHLEHGHLVGKGAYVPGAVRSSDRCERRRRLCLVAGTEWASIRNVFPPGISPRVAHQDPGAGGGVLTDLDHVAPPGRLPSAVGAGVRGYADQPL